MATKKSTTPAPAPKKAKAKAPAKKAKAKKASSKKAPAKKAKATGRPSRKAPLDGVIKVLVAKNPKRPTSAAGQRFDLYKPGMTVGEFLKAGGWRADINWDTKQGFIEVVKPS